MVEIHCILFDCDGTLVDTEAIAQRVLLGLIRQIGYPITDAEYTDRFVGTSLPVIMGYVQEQLGYEIDRGALEEAYRAESKVAFEREAVAIVGMVELVERLPCKYAVASNGPRVKMQVTLPTAGYASLFDEANTFSAYDIQRWKPDPALYLHAAAAMQVEPRQCLVVEDTIHGVEAALAAGMHVLGINVHHQRAAVQDLGVTIAEDGIALGVILEEGYRLEPRLERRVSG